MLPLFLDKDLLKQLKNNVLFEGVSYYLNTENFSKSLLDKWMEGEYISDSIKYYHPKNKILTLRFDNLVGLVNILGYQFDVRSYKLYDNISGNSQFQALLDEINKISQGLTFNFKGVTKAFRKTEYEPNWNILEVFDYYYQLVFSFSQTTNLDSLLNQCIFHPNTLNQEIIQDIDISKSKLISSDFYKKLGNNTKFGTISEEKAILKTSIAKKIFVKTNKNLIPTIISNRSFSSSLNTIENRFVKFFLEDINSTCLRILNSSLDVAITIKAKKLQNKIAQLLINPFFKNIQSLNFVPSSSSVLLRRSGYKEIYYHFVQSKFSFRPLLESVKKESHKSGLKKISNLYEIWVFFKIAELLFEDKVIQETFTGNILKNNSLISTYEWDTKNIKLFFNLSYSHGNNGSYSITLRPDISLEIDNENIFLFDAKYKFNSNENQEEEQEQDDVDIYRIIKPEDIHKMHTYIDAIRKAKTAIAIYPGSRFIFYDRVLGKIENHKSIKSLQDLNGVGACPLIPNLSNKELTHLLQSLYI